MAQGAGDGTATGSTDRLGRSVAAVVLIGAALGLGFNALGRAGKPQRGLPWIAEARTVAELPPGLPPRPAPHRAPVSDDPLAISVGVSGTGSGVPEVPDVGRPMKIQLAQAKQFFDAGAALFVDAREPADYAESHVPGAVNLPFDESVTDPERLEKLASGGRPIVVYCGGNGCEVSLQLADALVGAGHTKVLVDEGGFPEWKGAGYPTVNGSAPGGRTK
jgi:rhodanese-related sulfurtransferase